MNNLSGHYRSFFAKNGFGGQPSGLADNIVCQSEMLPGAFSFFLSGVEFDLSEGKTTLDYFVSLSNLGQDAGEVARLCCQSLESMPGKPESSSHVPDSQKPPTDTSGSSQSSGFRPLSDPAITTAIDSLYSDSPAISQLENIWFEFDNQGRAMTAPSIFMGKKRNFDVINQPETALASINDFVRQASVHFDLGINPGQFQEGIINELNRCFIFSHLGLMLRRNESMRFFYTGVSLGRLTGLIGKYNPGLSEALLELSAQLELYFDLFAVQVDPMDGNISRIGLECFIRPADDFIYSRKIKLMKKWLGERFSSPPIKLDNIPARLGQGHNLTNTGEIITGSGRFIASTMRSGLHHIKLSITGNGVSRVKAYLWFENDWKKEPRL